MSARGARLRSTVAVVVAGVALGACTTGETDADAHTEAVRRIVRDMGFTQDVAMCIVDEVEATMGLEVLDDAETSDDVTRDINQIATNCLLAEPEGGATTTGPASTVSLAPPPIGDPAGATTTTGAPIP